MIQRNENTYNCFVSNTGYSETIINLKDAGYLSTGTTI